MEITDGWNSFVRRAQLPRRLGALGLFLISVLVALFVLPLPAQLLARLLSRTRLAEIASESLYVALLIGTYGLLLSGISRSRAPMKDMGLPLARIAWRQTAYGLIIGIGMVCLGVGLLRLAGPVQFQVISSGAPAAAGLGYEAVLLAVAAMSEELLFRGYPFQRLVDAVGAIAAVVIFSGFLFGAMHLGNPSVNRIAVLNTAFVGVMFAIAYLRTRSLWLPWGIHFAWNFTLGALFGLRVSGLNFSTFLRGTTAAPAWLSGGAYGIEAGVAGTIAIAVGLIVVLLLPRTAKPAPTPDVFAGI